MKDDTKLKNGFEVSEIDTKAIKFFVRRSRPEGGYNRLKQSIKEVGLKQPIQVRDISGWPKSDRRRPDGELYEYELICGQGRLQAFRELGRSTIPAIVVQVLESEIVGRFLAENVMRRKLSWYERGQLVKGDFDRGLDVEAIKKKYFITTGHVYKYLRILRQASPKLRTEIGKLPMVEAEELTSLAPKHQEIVVEVLKEEKLAPDQIRVLVKKAKELNRNGEISKASLRTSLRDLDKALKEVRALLKVKMLHWSLGPHNLQQLLAIPEFKHALDSKDVDYAEFQKVTTKKERK